MKQKWNNYYLSTDYFEVIRINDTFIEFRSRNTKHQWIIHMPPIFRDDKPILIYHKHSKSVPYYHKHGYAYKFSYAIRSIIAHDEYVMSGMHKYNRGSR